LPEVGIGSWRMLIIESFEPNELSPNKLDKLIDLYISYYHELHPEDPPRSCELIRDFLLNPHPLWNFCRWLVIDTETDEIIGTSVLSYENRKSPQYDIKQNIADIFAIISKNLRREGLGSRLLDEIISEARKLDRTQLQGEFSFASSREFLLKHNAIITSERRIQRLYLKEVDLNTVKRWNQNGVDLNPGVKLHTFQVISEDLMEGYVNLYNETARQAPDYDSGESVPMELTSAVDRRETEKLVAGKDIIWITIMAEEVNGKLIGFTEIFQRRAEPFVLDQGQTGVLEMYRGRGLGKLLKAEMLDFIQNNLKGAGCVETGNANANAAMISINRRLGFREYMPHALFSLKIKEATLQ